ncbi:hypothetical protein GUA87_01640 [Sneathiella sp. P13V-1]|uniref:DUF6111 family protein n=1 Tax=Sneathiella sp. P13V-1 TaxID=2697366 RepID=UPI00187B6B04|nr:DUF6111 family protein [Sneathiella sp. P13V-1]MBE7635530.1 hypothetical protein [Sneathiella sp. P13V-1]
MIRTFLVHVIPLLLPFLVYAVYLYYVNKAGGEKTWAGKTVAVLAMIGLILMSLSFVALWAFTEQTPDGDYVPTRYKDGKLIESEIIPKPSD